MATNPVYELVFRESGTWAILRRTGSTATFIDTGLPDRELAANERDFYARFKTLSPVCRGWLKVAKRLARNMKTGRYQRRGSADHDIFSTTEILALPMEQGYACPISGSYFTHDAFDGDEVGPFQPSVDRIDTTRGYVRGNIRIVCLLVNVAMSHWGEAPLRKIAHRIVARGLRPVPQMFQGDGQSRFRLTSCDFGSIPEDVSPDSLSDGVSHTLSDGLSANNKLGETQGNLETLAAIAGR